MIEERDIKWAARQMAEGKRVRMADYGKGLPGPTIGRGEHQQIFEYNYEGEIVEAEDEDGEWGQVLWSPTPRELLATNWEIAP